MTALAVAVVGAYGVFLVVTAVLFGWEGLAPRPVPRAPGAGLRARAEAWVQTAGLEGVGLRQLAATSAVSGAVATVITVAVFGIVVPALAVGALAASFPLGSVRARRGRRRRGP